MRSIKSLVTCVFLLLAVMTTSAVCASNLVGIVVANTLPRESNLGREFDVQNMLDEMETIASITGLEFTPYIYIHEEYNSDLLNKLENIPVNDDDVVFFFYSGHGFREYDKDPEINPWPNIHISLENKGIDHEVITNLFEQKNPRLLLSIVNSCNRKIRGSIELLKRSNSFMIDSPLIENDLKLMNYRSLFLESRGKIVASSAIPGQVSYRNREYGSVFVNSLLSSLHEETETQELTNWDVIFQLTSDKVYDKTKSCFKGAQVAQYQIVIF